MDKNYHRRSVRLQPWYYFVTIYTFNKQELFGEVVGGEFRPNRIGNLVGKEIYSTSQIRPNVDIDLYQLMPHHVHLIINIMKRHVGA